MATSIRFHHRPTARTAYLLGRPASVWIAAIAHQHRGEVHEREGAGTDVD